VLAFPRHPQNRSRDNLKTIEVQTIILEVHSSKNEVQTIGIYGICFEWKFGSGCAGEMELLLKQFLSYKL